MDPELRQALEDFAARIEREFSETLSVFEREMNSRFDELQMNIRELGNIFT